MTESEAEKIADAITSTYVVKFSHLDDDIAAKESIVSEIAAAILAASKPPAGFVRTDKVLGDNPISFTAIRSGDAEALDRFIESVRNSPVKETQQPPDKSDG